MYEVEPHRIRAGDEVWWQDGTAIKQITATSPLMDGQLYYPVEKGNPRCGYFGIYLSQIIKVYRTYQPGDWKDGDA